MIGRPIYAVMEREVLRMFRQKTRLVSAMVRPLIWLFVIGAGFGTVITGTLIATFSLETV